MTKSSITGFKATLPLAASVAAYGSVLGVLSVQKGLSWLEILIMNLAIFAGSSQFVMVDMWNPPLPLFEMTLAVAVINLRYLLIGASLRDMFRGKPLMVKLSYMHMVTDENWALTMAYQREGKADLNFLLGGGVCVMTAWCLGTLSGLFFGAAVQNPDTYALDFAFTAVFTALAVSLWQGKSDILPWITAMVLALVAEKLLPGKWYILVGGLGGALTKIFIPLEQKEEKQNVLS
ncbi:AzlC family ABC transporter permease [Dethiosulfatarculus sandiegensis]|uniref:AzlC family ABC transporter permease n=1 Tax=Dethiosulfatarculus sandiegensis TaxID=1429043 RepID=UPI0005C8C817|nr:AzlC family ABC transporter permease [Dethiosulfatarculus sandiegensis]